MVITINTFAIIFVVIGSSLSIYSGAETQIAPPDNLSLDETYTDHDTGIRISYPSQWQSEEPRNQQMSNTTVVVNFKLLN
jgi:putative salt-induced outer membrane protein YdiY